MLSSRLPSSSLRLLDFFLLYAIYALVVGITLNIAGFNIAALLGAAGVFGVAIGFASQTAISNIISGIFLMLEQSLRVGDVIACGPIQGRIVDIGLLSMTLKTIENKLVRVPNEHLIKNTVLNLTVLKQRVVIFSVSVSNATDSHVVKDLLVSAWEHMALASKDKAISISYVASSEDTIGYSVNIWVKSADVPAAKSEYIELCSQAALEKKVPLYISPKS